MSGRIEIEFKNVTRWINRSTLLSFLQDWFSVRTWLFGFHAWSHTNLMAIMKLGYQISSPNVSNVFCLIFVYIFISSTTFLNPSLKVSFNWLCFVGYSNILFVATRINDFRPFFNFYTSIKKPKHCRVKIKSVTNILLVDKLPYREINTTLM